MLKLFSHTNLATLASHFIEASTAESGFLNNGNVIVCESRGLQQYLLKTCVDKYGIWAAPKKPFKPLAGLLMRCAYVLSPKDLQKGEEKSVFNQNNLVWAIYKHLDGAEKTFSFASELASLFVAYQIYRPEIIEKWNKNEPYAIKNPDENFKKHEKFQRNLWAALKAEYKGERDVSQIYKDLENDLKSSGTDKKHLPKRIFIFAPLSIAPIHLSALSALAEAGCNVNLYMLQISNEYIGEHLSDKEIAKKRKDSWKNNKILNETELYWDIGNRLTANLARTAQTFYEQLLEYEEKGKFQLSTLNSQLSTKPSTLLSKIQSNIINDNNEKTECCKDSSLTLNNCFSPLREIEVLHDYILDLFAGNKELKPDDIAIVSPNIENYASAIETVFSRNEILPYRIADRDVKKHDKAAQLLNLLFAQINSRYEAPDIIALYEYSMYVQGKELDSNDRELLEKWIRENAIRYGLNSSAEKPDYSFASGFDQLAAGFFMISETEFSEKDEYCYSDIEGKSAMILGDFVDFVNVLREFEEASKTEKKIEGNDDSWDYFFKIKLQTFFGSDETNFTEDKDNAYQKIINAWDSLKEEILIGFGANVPVNFAILKMALLGKLEANAKSSYSLSGAISCSNLDTVRAVPRKVICCVGMNSKEFPRQIMTKEISLMAEHKDGDKDMANEDRLMFLETICSAKEKLYISWVGQNEKTAEELDPSSVVVMLLENLKNQYGIEDIIKKHPLQPFSRKYFNGELETYDNRWHKIVDFISDKNIWKWKVKDAETEKGDVDALYRILNDASKYFLRNICNINLPEDIELLDSIEPLIVEKGLEDWKLADKILNKKDYNNDIEVSRLRGELPNGKFADKIIDRKIEQIDKMLELRDLNVKTFMRPSKDKGKYRLWHWLQHLKYNSTEEKKDTDIILIGDKKDEDGKKIRLRGLPKEEAIKEINRLWALADKLKEKMQPIFPDAAWEYKEKNMEEAKKKIFSRNEHENTTTKYSPYAKMVIGNAESFEDLDKDLENEFKEYSENLFKEYCKYRVEGIK